jgi:hypothetical protein
VYQEIGARLVLFAGQTHRKFPRPGRFNANQYGYGERLCEKAAGPIEVRQPRK